MSDDNNAELERLRSIEKLAGLLLSCDDHGNTTLVGHEKFRSALRRVCCWGGTLPKDYEHVAEIEQLRTRLAAAQGDAKAKAEGWTECEDDLAASRNETLKAQDEVERLRDALGTIAGAPPSVLSGREVLVERARAALGHSSAETSDR